MRQVGVADPPKCPACQLGKQHQRPHRHSHGKTWPEHEMSIKHDDLEPGDMTSVDQYLSTFGGRLPNTFGKEKKKDQYGGGTIFVDHATSRIYIRHQVSMQAYETVRAKQAYEKDSLERGVRIKGYRADNMPFNSKPWMDDITIKNQTIDFSGVGAHHQNRRAEKCIRDLQETTRAMLLHAARRWPNAITANLWPHAL